jgi:hypothetical protein
MAANAAEEAAFLDGTHPALQGNAQAKTTIRASSPELRSQRDDDHSPPSSPRFSAVDDDAPAFVPPPVNPPTRSGGASNTGPKGVLADWQAANTNGAASQTGPKGVLTDWRSNQATQAASALAQISLDDVHELGLDEDHLRDAVAEVGEGELRGEEAAKEAYRRKRLAEMSGSGQREARARNKTFGHLREIGFDQFLPAVEEEEDSVAVVLHLYEPVSHVSHVVGACFVAECMLTHLTPASQEIEACNILNSHLSALARQFPNTKFLRAMAGELDFAADAEFETLPTVLVYRGGDLETTMVRMDHDWGRGTQGEVEGLLRE